MSATATTVAALPASLTHFCDQRVPDLLALADPARMIALAQKVVAHDRWNSFDQFHQTTAVLAQAYAEAGVKTEVYAVPTGGPRGDGRWTIVEAQDVSAATLDLVAPEARRLLDYRQCPWHAIQWTAATPADGTTGELVVVDDEERLAKLPRGALAGKFVLTRLNAWKTRTRFAAAGAVGFLSDQPVKDCPDAVCWTKFGWGGLDLWDGGPALVGFSLSTPQGDELRRLVQQHRQVVVHAQVDARRYAGTHDVLSGIIPGLGGADEELWAVAHSSEPGALDNASGGVACVEIARVLTGLIAAGRLPRPRRTIRLIHAYECYGFFHYLEHQSRLQPPLAGVCVDTVGARPDLCRGELRWHGTVPASAPFVNDVGEAVLRAALAAANPGYELKLLPFVSTDDTLLGDPKYGFPCPWLTNHPCTSYHSSADTVELLDPRGLSACVTGLAGYLYYLAAAGTGEVLELAQWQTQRTVAALREAPPDSGGAVRRARLRHEHAATLTRLRRMLWEGDHAELAGRFEDLAREIAEVGPAVPADCAIGGEPKMAGTAGPTQADATAAIPLRRRPLVPTAENVWPQHQQRLSEGFPRSAAYWADGQRSITEIAALGSLETKNPIDPAKAAAYFAVLAELGYVELLDPADFITEEQLAADLAALGVQPGMDVMVHSALSKLGPVRGGAEAVVRALLAALGPEGTLLAPSFNHSRAQVFNPLTTPTTNGAIAQAAWRRAEAQRSLHPSHAVAAIGPRAAEYVADHLTAGIWAADSPIGRLIQRGGYILSLGVDHGRTTAYHVGEISLNVPCLDQFGSADYIVDTDGQVRRVPGLAWRKGDCPVPIRKIDELLDARGLQRQGKVGRADATLVRAAEVWAARRETLGDTCRTCQVRPERRERASP